MIRLKRRRPIFLVIALLAACGADGDDGGLAAEGDLVTTTTERATTTTSVATTTSAPLTVGADGVVQVEIVEFEFMPAEITIPAGTTVRWTNRDKPPHNIKDLDSRAFEEGEHMAQGESWEHTFEEVGEIRYICGLHQDMRAKVIVQ